MTVSMAYQHAIALKTGLPQKHPGGPPLKYKTPKKLQEAIERYFEKQENSEKPPTITGLALEIGLSRKQLIEYGGKEKFRNIIKNARMRIAAKVEEKLLTGQPATGLIFWMKNNAEWHDHTEQTTDTTIRVVHDYNGEESV